MTMLTGSGIQQLPSGLVFIPEAGFSGSGSITDSGSFQIIGSGFGTKSPVAPYVFDTWDTYWNEGVAENPYTGLNDGDDIPLGGSNPWASDMGAGSFIADEASRYGRRRLGYKSPVDVPGGNIDYWLEGWRGWPSAPSSINDFYARWYLWVEEGSAFETFLDGAHSSSATNITVTPGLAKLDDASAAPPIIIVLNDGSFHRTTQALPKISQTNFDIEDALPEAVDSGNSVYVGNANDSTKHIRVWDTDSGDEKTLRVSYTWTQLTTASENASGLTEPTPRSGGVGVWNLVELRIHCVTDEVDINDGTAKGFLNNVVNGDLSGAIQKSTGQGGTWPFDGIIPRLIGLDSSAASTRFKIPNNFIQIAEIYADRTYQRIELSDHPTDLFQSTVREVCMPTGWIDGQLDFLLNQGRHISFDGVRIYATDVNNAATLLGKFGFVQ